LYYCQLKCSSQQLLFTPVVLYVNLFLALFNYLLSHLIRRIRFWISFSEKNFSMKKKQNISWTYSYSGTMIFYSIVSFTLCLLSKENRSWEIHLKASTRESCGTLSSLLFYHNCPFCLTVWWITCSSHGAFFMIILRKHTKSTPQTQPHTKKWKKKNDFFFV